MQSNNRIEAMVFILLLTIFVGGMVWLFVNLFNRGDIYPVYSSLRTDPLGIRAFYESLEETGRFKTLRNYGPIEKVSQSQTATHLVVGIHAFLLNFVPEKNYKKIDSTIQAGARVVFTFFPTQKKYRQTAHTSSWPFVEKDSLNKKDTLTAKKDTLAAKKDTLKDTLNDTLNDSLKDKKSRKSLFYPKMVSLFKKWGFSLRSVEFPTDSLNKPTRSDIVYGSSPGVTDSLKWYSGLVFDTVDTAWQTICQRDTFPVLIERKLGEGSIVLSTDSYFFSNEALAHDRATDLLVWIVGPHDRVIFHETHHGIMKHYGIASLLKKYNLYGFFVGIVLLFLLYVWKNIFPLITLPGHAKDKAVAYTVDQTGEGSTGLRSLLRRTLDKSDIIDVCIEEWRKSSPQRRDRTESIYKKMQVAYGDYQLKTDAKKSRAGLYNEICNVINAPKERTQKPDNSNDT